MADSRALRVVAVLKGAVKAVPVSAGLGALLKAAERAALPPALADELPDLPPARLEGLARRAMVAVPEGERRGLEREARKLIGLGEGDRRHELVVQLAGKMVAMLAAPLAHSSLLESGSDAARAPLPVTAAPGEELAAPLEKPVEQPAALAAEPSEAPPAAPREEPPPPQASPPQAEQAAAAQEQPTDQPTDQPTAPDEEPPPEPSAEQKPPAKPAAADPFADDPLAAASPLDPASVPAAAHDPFRAPTPAPPAAAAASAPAPARARATADPFANDPLAAAAPLDPAALAVKAPDPFGDDGDLIAPVVKQPRGEADRAARGRRGPPPPAIKFGKKPGAGSPPPPAIGTTAKARKAPRPASAPPAASAPATPAVIAPAPAAPVEGGARRGAAGAGRPPAREVPAARPAPAAVAVAAAPEQAPGPAPDAGATEPAVAPAPGVLRAVGLAGAAAAVLLALGGLGLGAQRLLTIRHERAKQAFLDLAGQAPLEESLAAAEALDPDLQADPEVTAEVKRLKGKHAQLRRRAAAEQLLSEVPATATPEERLKAAGIAIATDDTFSRAYVVRAALKERLARRSGARSARAEELRAIRSGALLDLGLALEHDPNCHAARFLRARLLLEGRQATSGALTPRGELEEVSDRAKDGPLGQLARGWLRLLEGDARAAGEAFAAALRAAERGQPAASGLDLALEAHLGRAQALLRQGDRGAAREAADAAVRRDAGCAEALLWRARAVEQSQREQARRDLERALELDPLSADGLALLALSRLERDRDGLALPGPALSEPKALAERAQTLVPGHPLAKAALALVAQAEKRAADALELASQAVAEAGVEAEPWATRGLLQTDPRRALQDLEAALQRQPDHVVALVRSGALLAEGNDAPQARARLDRALAVDADQARALFFRGVVAMRDRPRDLRAALRDFDRALVLDPRQADALLMRAYAHADLNQPQQALADLQSLEGIRAHATLPIHDRFLIKGNCLYDLRQWEQAREAYRRFLEQAPGDSPWVARVQRRIEDCQRRLGAAGTHREY